MSDVTYLRTLKIQCRQKYSNLTIKKTTFPSVISTLCPVMTIISFIFFILLFFFFSVQFFFNWTLNTILSLSFLQIFKTYAIFNCEWSNYHGHVSYKLNFLTLYLHIFACCRCPSCLSSSPCTSRGADTRLCPEDITHMLDFWEYFAKSHDTVIVVNIYIVICP